MGSTPWLSTLFPAVSIPAPGLHPTPSPLLRTDDIYYNAVAAIEDESGNSTGTGPGESMEYKLEQLSNIDSVEVKLGPGTSN